MSENEIVTGYEVEIYKNGRFLMSYSVKKSLLEAYKDLKRTIKTGEEYDERLVKYGNPKPDRLYKLIRYQIKFTNGGKKGISLGEKVIKTIKK